MLQEWTRRAAELKKEVHAVYLACKDPRVPWHIKLLGLCIAGYTLSPIDLIPDFIPILGYLDDLVLVPLGIYVLLKGIPAEVIAECRENARLTVRPTKPHYVAAITIVVIWIIFAVVAFRVVAFRWIT